MVSDPSSRNDEAVPPPYPRCPPYESPEIFELGSIRDLVKGSSSSGSADANSQYYW